MNANDLNLRVRLDTSVAQSDLAQLLRETENTAAKASESLSARFRAGFMSAGGAKATAAFNEARAPTMMGVGDILSDQFSGVGQSIADYFLGDLNDEARASARAREATIASFAQVTGFRKSVPPEAIAFYNATKSRLWQEEAGREILIKDPNLRSDGFTKLIDKFLKDLEGVMTRAFLKGMRMAFTGGLL